MAKKKSASSAVTESSASAKKPSSKSTGSKSADSKSAGNGDVSTAAEVLGADQIGMTAGSVWIFLTDNGPTPLSTLKKSIDAPADLILAAVGWLAREEKIEFSPSGKSVTLALK